MRPLEAPPDGWLVLQDHDRFVRGMALEPETGRTERLADGVVHAHGLDGWCAVRQKRLLALYRHRDRITYRCGGAVWDVHEARVSAGNIGMSYWIRFEDERGTRTCRFADWELARRWFIPEALDFTPMAEAEDFNWALFVRNLMTDPERRERIGRIPPIRGPQQ